MRKAAYEPSDQHTEVYMPQDVTLKTAQPSLAEADHYPPSCPQSQSTRFVAGWQYGLTNVGPWWC